MSQVQDDPARHDYNVDAWVDKIIAAANDQAVFTKTIHQMWPCGSDFECVVACSIRATPLGKDGAPREGRGTPWEGRSPSF